MNDLVPVTVTDILQKFDASNIEYAVLRNYEQLPNIGHDLDLVCTESQIEKIREILVSVAKQHGWEHLVEFQDYRSALYMYNICVFKFYNLKSNDFLQIDLFGGFSIWAMDGITAVDFIARRVKQDFFYRIDFYDELIIRAMQLGCAMRDKSISRVDKLKNIIANGSIKKLESAFVSRTQRKVSPDFLHYMNEDECYKRKWQKYKVRYLLSFAVKRPFYTGFCFLMRVWYLVKLNCLYSPGIMLFINRQEYKRNSAAIVACLSRLQESNFIMSYHVVCGLNLRNLKKIIQVKKMGGIVVWPTVLSKSCLKVSDEILVDKLVSQGLYRG